MHHDKGAAKKAAPFSFQALMPTNFERMIQLADEFFQTKNDPAQLSITEEVMDRLQRLHPATLSDYDDGNGPVVWILLIPTTAELERQFVSGEIGEKELLDLTPVAGPYQSIYLCSALVLPEFRGKGLAKRVALESIKSIAKDHPIKSLFFWAFSREGAGLAEVLARETGLPLSKRPE